MAGLQSWSKLYECRQRVKAAHPSIWRLPVVKKELDRLLPLAESHKRVLEIGAGDRRFGRRMTAALPDLYYKSMDIDRETEQDYYSLDDLDETFDFIYAFELIEHLTPDDGLDLLRHAHRLLRPEGVLLLGTPNLYHLMVMAGFKVPRFFRIYNDAFLRRTFRLNIGVWLHRYLDIDFAHTILAEAERP
ncbi:MAG: class I SAM-dependent methyltransferase [Gammaproteobacteria bacterium]